MKFWNFCHNVIGIHVYEFLALVLVVIMLVIAVIHFIAKKRRQREYEAKLEELKATSASGEEEPAPIVGEGA